MKKESTIIKHNYSKNQEFEIEGNPYKNQDFFIYRNGKEVVSWNADEMAEDEFSEETAQLMYDLYNKDKKELSKRLDKISYAEGGEIKNVIEKAELEITNK